MGNISRLIIRIGATGGTARWVAKHYLRLKDKGASDAEVFKELVDFRYKIFNLNQAKDKLTGRLSYLNNLTDLTFSILQLEGAIKTQGMSMYLQMEIISVIMEELEKKGISSKLIRGESVS